MKTIIQKLSNGNKIEYKKTESGTCYHAQTNLNLVNILETARINRSRIRIWFGDTKTGRSWNEENDIIGCVGRSIGDIKIPLLVYNTRSIGGGGILDHYIVKVIDIKTGRVLWQHEKFHQGVFTVSNKKVFINSTKHKQAKTIYANCRDKKAALRLADFMNGKRNSK